MDREPIDIVRVFRRMRGGSQAHLVQCQDGHFYVAKFTGNPQGTRTLINEWFAHHLCQQLGISIPPLRILRLTQAMQKGEEDLVFLEGKTRTLVEPGLHFGSQCPINPKTDTIFDFVPRKVLSRVANPEDFARMLVLDLFLGQTDNRQAIFVRETSGNTAWRLRAYLIDHGWALGGTLWQLIDQPRHHLYFDRTIYSLCDLLIECEQALGRILSLTPEHLHHFSETIPPIWFSQSDKASWALLLRQLSARKYQLPGLLDQCLRILRVDKRDTLTDVGCEKKGTDITIHPNKECTQRAGCFAASQLERFSFKQT